MTVGLCFDLRNKYLSMGYSEEETAEFDKPETIDGIESALQACGFKVERIGNARQLCEMLCKGKRWNIVFNICEGLRGTGREAQVPAILDLYNIPYVFSGPLVLSLSLHKGMAKRVVRDLGYATPDFYVIEAENDIDRVDLRMPLFVKPVAEGTGKGINDQSIVYDREQLRVISMELLAKYPDGILAESLLPGREFTVGITGSGKNSAALGTIEIKHNFRPDEKAVYSYETKENYITSVSYVIPERKVALECEELALNIYKGLGCLDAGRVDLKMDGNGKPSFIEINPLAGLNPVDSDLPILAGKHGIGYNKLISMIMDSALDRIFRKSIKNC